MPADVAAGAQTDKSSINIKLVYIVSTLNEYLYNPETNL